MGICPQKTKLSYNGYKMDRRSGFQWVTLVKRSDRAIDRSQAIISRMIA
jgi:hypothetical protein